MYIVKNNMSDKFHLIAQTQDGADHRLSYQLATNPIAKMWMEKIKHISKLPLDPIYTSKNDPLTKEELNANMAKDIKFLNDSIGRVYDIKSEYDQQDCNNIHAYTIRYQYDHPVEIRNVFHRLHRQLHLLEDLLLDTPSELLGLNAEWGEAGGLLTTTHKTSPYEYYTLRMIAGCLYQRWAEFGKTPYTYWKDQDLDDPQHFLATCKPHITFRPGFALCMRDHVEICQDTEFESWFKKYKQIWHEKYQVPDMAAYGLGSILLAEPLSDYSHILANIYTLKAVKLD